MDERVDWRVQVYWEGEDEWFEGVIREYDEAQGYYVCYDDGEEQWESAGNPEIMRFLRKDGQDDEENVVPLVVTPEDARWSNEPPPSSNGYEDDAYDDEYEQDDDHEKEEEEEEEETTQAPSAHSTTPEKDESRRQKPVKMHPVNVRDPTRYMGSDVVFFRDEETLRERKAAIQKELKAIKQEHEGLTSQLRQKEQHSTQLKRQLDDLKAQVTLSGFLTKSGTSQKPKTATQWLERVTQQKIQNRLLQQELTVQQSALQQKKARLLALEQQRDQLQKRLDRVPKKELCSLVEVQMEITRLLNEKRGLEAKLVSKTASAPSGKRDEKPRRQQELEIELRKHDQVVARLSDEVDRWKLSVERENARLAPLRARLTSLHDDLSKYASSKVLLRSAFLRFDREGSGTLTRDAALDALVLLAPPGAPQSREELARGIPNAATITFDMFATYFDQLCEPKLLL
ncbi:hypothetical protein Poli38472_012108 [Pythium oligandrum]|uniref:EF-hand domain-containing protein n=1 Tax=Pythium oligandrum TaxID=41045 RepID=A0A8K1FPK4_PYTOL|nr:hypothetical protein Poli38472_012108 [Pythium oligandrum]|eukprot:TMW66992.1 hypothetical protein Poli38472_012108 [Pythium oligandrum]